MQLGCVVELGSLPLLPMRVSPASAWGLERVSRRTCTCCIGRSRPQAAKGAAVYPGRRVHPTLDSFICQRAQPAAYAGFIGRRRASRGDLSHLGWSVTTQITVVLDGHSAQGSIHGGQGLSPARTVSCPPRILHREDPDHR